MKKIICLLLLCINCLAQQITVSEIIQMKTNGVSDAVMISLINSRTNTSPSIINKTIIDPESYDFFWSNYLYPRTIQYQHRVMGQSNFINRKYRNFNNPF
jgi:hypothetical protein